MGRILPYLLAILGAKAACTCPDRLWLPGVMGGWKPSLGHLLSAGQLPPAQLLVRLLVYHQQPGLPFHSLDPLDHLGQAGGRGSAASSLGSTWTVAPPKAGQADLLGVGGWARGLPAPPPTPGFSRSLPPLLGLLTEGPRRQGPQCGPRPCLSPGSSPGSWVRQPCRHASVCVRSVLSLGLKGRHLPGVSRGVSVPISVFLGGGAKSLPLGPLFAPDHEHRSTPAGPAGFLWEGACSGTTHDAVSRIQTEQAEVWRGRSNCAASVICGPSVCLCRCLYV